MKFLLDQGIGRFTVSHLQAAGFSAEHVGDVGLAASPDQVILNHAAKSKAVVITLDADFHQLLAMTRAPGPSVIRIRIEGLKSEAIARLFVRVAAQFENELHAGAVISVSLDQARARLLPIGT
jgi:predicted nuclease of predicted toxin-antitoxin system